MTAAAAQRVERSAFARNRGTVEIDEGDLRVPIRRTQPPVHAPGSRESAVEQRQPFDRFSPGRDRARPHVDAGQMKALHRGRCARRARLLDQPRARRIVHVGAGPVDALRVVLLDDARHAGDEIGRRGRRLRGGAATRRQEPARRRGATGDQKVVARDLHGQGFLCGSSALRDARATSVTKNV